MANTFKNMTLRGDAIGADTLTNLGDFGGVSNAVASGSQITLIGMTIANVTSSVIAVGVKLINASNETWLVRRLRFLRVVRLWFSVEIKKFVFNSALLLEIRFP